MSPIDRLPSPGPESTAPARASSGVGASLLLSRGAAARGDSRRVGLAFVALGLVIATVLNIGLYENERAELVTRRWEDLDRGADAARNDVRVQINEMHHQLARAAQQPSLLDAIGAAKAAPSDLQAQMNRLADDLNLFSLVLVDVRGATSAGQKAVALAGGELETLARRARDDARGMAVISTTSVDGQPTIGVAAVVPLTAVKDTDPVLVSLTPANVALGPLMTHWIAPGLSEHIYLVRREGGNVVAITPSELAPLPSGQISIDDRAARTALMAASGVEANVEVASGRSVAWVTTRHIPEFGWGLVGEARRDAMLAGLSRTLITLALLDLALLLCVGFAIWYWRRQALTEVEQRTTTLTERHAARIQAMLDTAFDAIFTFDQTGRVLAANKAAEKMFGRPLADLDGQPLHRLLLWDGGERSGSQALPTPGLVCAAEGKRAGGQVFPVEISVGQAGEGEELLYTAIVREISERIEADKRIRVFAEGLEASNRRLAEMNAQLEEASRLKSEFLANTSHELRTPLNGMIGFLQLVLDGLCESPEEEREFLRQGLQCSRHLLGLINDVLDIAKIEAGKLEVAAEKVDVASLFADVSTVTHVQAQQAGITLRFEPPADEDVCVRCDLAKTKQVLINLVGNSLKFTPKGSVTVRATAHPDLGHMMFEVADTGIGIPPARQSAIFEKFTQADGSTTRRFGGTGLGLAISRSLVELMGGIIGVQSEGEGKGTRMYFSLPVWEDAAALVEKAQPDSDRIEGPAHGPLVLVVEDDPAFRGFIVTLLHKNGYRTVQCATAEGGWVLVRRLQPAALVLDYALSCAEGAILRTGLDLAERMASDAETRHIPLIFVTGFDAELHDKLKFTVFVNAPEHIMKPMDGSVLLAKLEERVGSIQDRSVRVLLADDDPTVAAYVRRVLPESRFHLEVANNGEEALHVLKTQPRGFDLLLLDLMMPDVSGYDVLRELTLSGAAHALPVLVLTNFPEARNAEERRLLDHGLVLDVLPKPAVHDNPQLLSHIIDWHVQVATDRDEKAAA